MIVVAAELRRMVRETAARIVTASEVHRTLIEQDDGTTRIVRQTVSKVLTGRPANVAVIRQTVQVPLSELVGV